MKKSFFSLKSSSAIEDAAGVKLIVKVLKAEGVLAKDRGGTSDPFAEVRLGKQSKKTKVVQKTLNPQWDESFTFDLPEEPPPLDVILYDHDKGLLGGSSEYLGSVSLDGSLFTPGAKIEEWYELIFDKRFQKKEEAITGRIQLSVQVVGSPQRELSGIESSASGLASVNADDLATNMRSISMLSSSDKPRRSSLEAVEAMVLELTVHKAEGLVAMDRGGTSDPFVEVQLGKQKKKTKVKPKTLNPQFDETFLLDYTSSMTTLSVVLYDHDKGILGSSADYLGSAEVDLAVLTKDEPLRQGGAGGGPLWLACSHVDLDHHSLGQWYPLEFDKKYHKKKEFAVKGRVMLGMTARAPANKRSVADTALLPHPYRDLEKAQQLKAKGIGTLEVTVLGAERLMAADRGGTSDPFVELNVGGNKAKTRTKKKTLDPEWDEPFSLEVPAGAACLEALVMDENLLGSSTFLGQVVICLDDLVEGEEVVHTCVLQPRTHKHKASVGGSLQLFLTLVARGASVIQVPEVNLEELKQRQEATGRGAATVCVIGAMGLPLSDPNAGAYVEVHAGGTKTVTRVATEGQCPVWNATFLVELPGDAQVVDVVALEKSSGLAARKGDEVLGTATLFLADLPEELTYAWSDLVPPRATESAQGALKLCTAAHLVPQLPLNRLRREVTRIRENASKGLGTLELLVVAAKHLPPSMDGAIRQVMPAAGGRGRGSIASISQQSREGRAEWGTPAEAATDLMEEGENGERRSERRMEEGAKGERAASGGARWCGDKADWSIGWLMRHGSEEELDATAREQVIVTVTAGNKKVTIEGGSEGLNPVWNKGVTLDIDPDVLSVEIEVLDKAAEPGQKTIGSLLLLLEELEEGVEFDRWHDIKAPEAFKAAPQPSGRRLSTSEVSLRLGAVRLLANYVQKIAYIDPAERGLQQSAIGDVEVVCIAARGVGLLGGSAESESSVLPPGTLMRCEGQIGVARRQTQVGKPAPNPIWNERLMLKLPHPTAVLEVHVLVEHQSGEVSHEPFGTAQVALGELKDEESAEGWHPLISKQHPGLPSDQPGESVVGNIQLVVTVRRNYGFNLELLGGLVACPWRCGTSFDPDEAAAHFIVCPLAPDPTAQVACVHLAIGCKFKGPRFGMKDHLAVCPFEPLKGVLRGYVKEIRSLRSALELQDQETQGLREKVEELQREVEGKDKLGEAAHQRLKAGPSQEDQDVVRDGAGLVDTETTMEAMQHKIIKWMPQGCTFTLEGHTDGVVCLAHSAQHKKLLSGSLDRTIKVWDISLHEPVCDGDLRGHRGGVTSIAFGGHRLVSGSTDTTIKLWDMGTMREEAKLGGHTGLVHGLILLNEMCISASQDKSIRIWDMRQRECVTTMDTKSRGCYGMAIHELKLLSASGSKIYTWDLRKVAASTMNEQQRLFFGRYDTLTGNTSGVYGHQMVGDRLYTSAVDNSVRLWDLRSLQVKSKIVGHLDFVRALATAGERLLTGSDDKTIRVWDLEFHDCARVLKGHTSYINALLCARARLFSASMDKTVKIWE